MVEIKGGSGQSPLTTTTLHLLQIETIVIRSDTARLSLQLREHSKMLRSLQGNEFEILVAGSATGLFALLNHKPDNIMIFWSRATSATYNTTVVVRRNLHRIVECAEGPTQYFIVLKNLRVLNLSAL